jgi:hypothetical protein
MRPLLKPQARHARMNARISVAFGRARFVSSASSIAST